MEDQTIESIILRHSKRGMDKLAPYLSATHCLDAAKYILSFQKGIIFITTGFYVGGFAETDGPLGAMVLSKALMGLGYRPYIITDFYCKNYFESVCEQVIYAPIDGTEAYFRTLIETYQPTGMISVERCGINTQEDYANMRGISIRPFTPSIDTLFSLAPSYQIKTVGIGDGGNEIGMGNLAKQIKNELSLIPCKVCTDQLVIASVSNWGCYGIVTYLEQLTGSSFLGSKEEILSYLDYIVSLGCVDGVTKEHVATVDGYPIEIEEEILDALILYFTRSDSIHA